MRGPMQAKYAAKAADRIAAEKRGKDEKIYEDHIERRLLQGVRRGKKGN